MPVSGKFSDSGNLNLDPMFFFRPANRKELFNLRHAQARNVVERIFGVIKGRWEILTRPPEYDMDVQARVLPALAALHNFILKHDVEEREDVLDTDLEDPNPGTRGGDFGTLADGATTTQEKTRSELRRDTIAQEMWESYQELLQDRGENFDEHFE